jgi:RNA polymerase sigma factor (sigma-70 family)
VNDRTDQQLLRDYAERRSEAAFNELVRRHVDLVHSAAFRMTGEAHSAEDVTQAVFVALAQNVARLIHHPVLSGWLYTTARNLAAKYVRATVRRQNREQEAMNELLSAGPDASWEQIAPHLDVALGELSEADRDAVLLRFFEKKSAVEMAAVLGISGDAAQKRVSRAVERLRKFFTKRGVSVGAGGLVVAISAHAVQAAPVGLTVSISAAALTGTPVSTATVVATTTKAIAMTTLQKTLVTAIIAALAGAGVYEAHQASQLRSQVQTLQQQRAPIAEELDQLKSERDEIAGKLAALRQSNEQLIRDSADLLKLRAEVGALRRQAAEVDRLRKDNLELPQRDQVNAQTNVSLAQLHIAKVLLTRIKQPQTVSEELIRSNIAVKVGDSFERASVDVDVRKLYNTGWFSNVRVAESNSSEGVTLNYLLQEKPKLAQVRFSGNSQLDEKSLGSVVSSKDGQLLDERTLSADAQRIYQVYLKSGFPTAEVKYVLSVNEDTGEGDVLFQIVE